MNMFNISFLWMEISIVGGGSFFFFFFFLGCSPFGRVRPFYFQAADTTKVFEPPADVERKEQKESVQR